MGAVAVWLARPDSVDPQLEGWLAPEEQACHRRFLTDALRREYLATRALCRWALSRAVPEVAPEEWRFERSATGKPFVSTPAVLVPAFNLSNTPGLVACAVADVDVGVDVEPLERAADLLATAADVFSERERAAIAALPEALRGRRAVETWTTKEAWLKASGEGISRRLSRVDLSGGADGWQIACRHVPPAFILAIAAGSVVPVEISVEEARW